MLGKSKQFFSIRPKFFTSVVCKPSISKSFSKKKEEEEEILSHCLKLNRQSVCVPLSSTSKASFSFWRSPSEIASSALLEQGEKKENDPKSGRQDSWIVYLRECVAHANHLNSPSGLRCDALTRQFMKSGCWKTRSWCEKSVHVHVHFDCQTQAASDFQLRVMGIGCKSHNWLFLQTHAQDLSAGLAGAISDPFRNKTQFPGNCSPWIVAPIHL